MKRRDFIIGATSSIGTLLSGVAHAAPCPPPSLDGSSSTKCPTFTGNDGDTPLSNVIDGMGVNSWAELPATFPGGVSDFFKPSPSTEGIADFSHQGYYDPVRRKLFFIGAGYGGICGYVVYDENTDTWSRKVFGESIIHSWDHVAYDASRGYLYFSGQLGGALRRIDVDTGTLTYEGSLPWNGSVDTYGMEYWPSKDGIIISNRTGDAYFRPHGGSFALITGNLRNAGYHSMLAHNPVRDVMYWGGGNGTTTQFSEIATNGTVKDLDNAYHLYVADTRAICDPVTGDLIVQRGNGGSPAMSKYVHGSGWSTISSSVPSFVSSKRNAWGASIQHPLFPTKGVFVYLVMDAASPSEARAFLYRYS